MKASARRRWNAVGAWVLTLLALGFLCWLVLG